MPKNKEFKNFDSMMRKLVSVPHDQIKAVLDEEKREKAAKKRKSKTPASGRVSDTKA
jgi:hypothetical protein